MSLKIKPKAELSEFELQYLRDRMIDPAQYIVAADDEAEDAPYPEWDVDELEAEVKLRNKSRDEEHTIVPATSGKNGKVLKADLIAALEADDEWLNQGNDEGDDDEANAPA